MDMDQILGLPDRAESYEALALNLRTRYSAIPYYPTTSDVESESDSIDSIQIQLSDDEEELPSPVVSENPEEPCEFCQLLHVLEDHEPMPHSESEEDLSEESETDSEEYLTEEEMSEEEYGTDDEEYEDFVARVVPQMPQDKDNSHGCWNRDREVPGEPLRFGFDHECTSMYDCLCMQY